MGERVLVLRLALFIISLLFQFVGFIFTMSFGIISIAIKAGAIEQGQTDMTLNDTLPALILGIILFLIGRAAWKGQKRCKQYYKSHVEKVKSSGKEDMSSMDLLYFESHKYYLIYDYTNAFVNSIIEYIKHNKNQNAEIEISQMGDLFGVTAAEIMKIPEGFLIYGKDKSGGKDGLKEERNHVITGRSAINHLIGLVDLPASLSFLVIILFFMPAHEVILHRIFLYLKNRSPELVSNVIK